MLIQIFSLLFSLDASASQCPDLSGAYHCTLENNQYSRFEVKQKKVSSTPEVVSYSFNYLAIPGDADVISASTSGEADDMGWLTKCSKNKLIAIPMDGSMLSEIYLDSEKAFVRTLNGNIVQWCPRANSDN